MSNLPESIYEKKREKFTQMEEYYYTLINQLDNIEIYEENLRLLRRIIEVIIWGDQNKVPFTAVSEIIIRNSLRWTSSSCFYLFWKPRRTRPNWTRCRTDFSSTFPIYCRMLRISRSSTSFTLRPIFSRCWPSPTTLKTILWYPVTWGWSRTSLCDSTLSRSRSSITRYWSSEMRPLPDLLFTDQVL